MTPRQWSASLFVKRIRSSLGLLSFILMTGLPDVSQCAESASDATVDTLPEMTVTATRGEPRAANNLPVSTTTLTKEDIRRSPGTTPDELLRNIPSIQIPLAHSTATFPANPSASLRGVGVGDTSTRVLFLKDGLPMNSPFFGNVYWNRLPTNNLQRIEVVRGATSGLFGHLGMGGAIHFQTNEIEDQRAGYFSARYGSFNTYQLNGNVSAPITDSFKVGLNADWFQTWGYPTVVSSQQGKGDRDDVKSDYLNLGAKAEWDIVPGSKLLLGGGYYIANADGADVVTTNQTIVKDIQLGLRQSLGEFGNLKVDARYLEEKFKNNNGAPTQGGVFRDAFFLANPHETPSHEWLASAVWSRAFGQYFPNVNAGVDFRYIDGEDRSTDFSRNPVPGTFRASNKGEGQQRSVGLFAAANITPLTGLELFGNIRQDWFKNIDIQTTTNGVTTSVPNKTFTPFTYRTGGRYQVLPIFAVKGSAYRGFRAPNLSELLRSFTTGGFRSLSNPNLNKETIHGGEGGVELNLGRFSTEVNYFHTTTENFIGTTTGSFIFPFFTVQVDNVAEVRSRGVEIISKLKVAENILANGDDFFIEGSYTNTDSEVTKSNNPDVAKGSKTEGVPRHFGAFSVNYRNPSGFNMQFRGRSQSKTFLVTGASTTNTDPVSPTVIFDIFLSYKVHQFRYPFEVFVIGENIGDYNYTASDIGTFAFRGRPLAFFGGIRVSSF